MNESQTMMTHGNPIYRECPALLFAPIVYNIFRFLLNFENNLRIKGGSALSIDLGTRTYIVSCFLLLPQYVVRFEGFCDK